MFHTSDSMCPTYSRYALNSPLQFFCFLWMCVSGSILQWQQTEIEVGWSYSSQWEGFSMEASGHCTRKTFLCITKQKFIIDMLQFARGVIVAATGKCWLCMNLQAQLSAIILKSHKVDAEAIYYLDFLLPYFCTVNHHAWCLALLAPYQCDFTHCLCTKCSVNFKFPIMTLSLAWGRAASATQIIKHAPCKINTVSLGLTDPGLKHIVLLLF